ncbi:unnamed protein product [Leuciscus chuanchicus]
MSEQQSQYSQHSQQSHDVKYEFQQVKAKRSVAHWYECCLMVTEVTGSNPGQISKK